MKVKLVLPALIEAAAPGYSAQFATPVSPLDRKRRPMFPPLGLAQLAAFLPKARYSSTRDRSLAQVRCYAYAPSRSPPRASRS